MCALAIAWWALAGCAGSKGPRFQRVITHWGTYAVDDGVQLQVSTLGMSQMRYELRHVPSNRVLISDVGRDTKGWFFVWDDRGRLWAHWADLGTVVWVPVSGDGFQRQILVPGSSLPRDVPPEVLQHLPGWARKSLGLAPGS